MSSWFIILYLYFCWFCFFYSSPLSRLTQLLLNTSLTTPRQASSAGQRGDVFIKLTSLPFYFSSMEIFCLLKKKLSFFPRHCRMGTDEAFGNDVHWGLLLRALAAIRLLIHLHILGKRVVSQNLCLSLGTAQKHSLNSTALPEAKAPPLALGRAVAPEWKTIVGKWHYHQRWWHSKSSSESTASRDASSRSIHSPAFPQGTASCEWLH